MLLEGISKQNYQRYNKMIDDYFDRKTQNQIVVFGAGVMGQQFMSLLYKRGVNNVVFCDNNEALWNTELMGTMIVSSDYLINKYTECDVFLAIEKYDVLETQLIGMGYERDKSYYVLKNINEDVLVCKFKDIGEPSTLCLADCTVTTISLEEEKKQSISEMIEANSEAIVLSLNGLYTRQFFNILSAVLNKSKSIDEVIILTGIDIFSNRYNMFPNNQHLATWERLFDKSDLLAIEPEFLEVIKKREKSINFKGVGKKNLNCSLEEKLILARTQDLQLNYLLPINSENESILYLKKICDLCAQKKIHFKYVILPINYKLAKRLNNNFDELYLHNINIIETIIQQNMGEMCDLSFLLDEKDFIVKWHINEGIRQEGRSKVYEAIKVKQNGLYN